jgi:tetratricopeptide (TPR) repeat protein
VLQTKCAFSYFDVHQIRYTSKYVKGPFNHKRSIFRAQLDRSQIFLRHCEHLRGPLLLKGVMEKASPYAVVIPLGVPEGHEGLGLGMAALMMGLTRARGQALAIAQMFAETPAQIPAKPVEAFITARGWKTISHRPEELASIELVLTGSFEPPEHASTGSLSLLVYNAKTGDTLATLKVVIDPMDAGTSVGNALRDLEQALMSEAENDTRATSSPLHGLDWEALQSVLLAERCELHDQARGGPHDRFAAFMHLERAIEDAPASQYAPERLASIAFHTFQASANLRLDDAALRTVKRALVDVPEHAGLHDAALALEVKQGALGHAGVRAKARIEDGHASALTFALLAEVMRREQSFETAATLLEAGFAAFPEHPALLTERGALRAEQKEWPAAVQDLRQAIEKAGPDSNAFFKLAELALHVADVDAGSSLVDLVLQRVELRELHVHFAVKLAMQLEPDGVHRASRIAKLGKRLIDMAPEDPRPHLLTSRALARMGERDGALYHLDRIDELAPKSTWSSEAALGRFNLEHPEDALELEALVRATSDVTQHDLPTILLRAQRFALLHESLWLTHFALGLSEARATQFASAKRAFQRAAQLAPGSIAASRELARTLIELGEQSAALTVLEKARAHDPFDGSLYALSAEAHHREANNVSAIELAAKALELEPNNEVFKALAQRVAAHGKSRSEDSWLDSVRSWGARWGKA